MSATEFIQEFTTLPEHLQQEVSDFMAFLKQRLDKEPDKEQPNRRLGLGKGLVEMMPDFDDPIPGFEDYQ